jgi:hypothetical protein
MVVVWARNGVCADPETGARDQYIPDDGAAGTSGDVLGSARGGKGICWGIRAAEPPPRPPPRVVALPRAAPVVLPPAMIDTLLLPTGLLPPAIAEVERNAVGRRVALLLVLPSLPLPVPDESWRSRVVVPVILGAALVGSLLPFSPSPPARKPLVLA